MRLPAAAPNSWPEQNARRRTVQQPMRTAQGRHISQRPVVTEQPAPAPEPPVQERAQQAAPAPEKPRELTYAQRQAMAYRAAAERRYGDTLQFQVQRPRRTVNRPPEPEQRARQAAAQLYEQPAAPRQVQQHAPRPAQALCSRRPPSAASGWRRLPRSPAAQSMRMPRSPQPISPAPPQAAMAAAASPRAMRRCPAQGKGQKVRQKGQQRQRRKREKEEKDPLVADPADHAAGHRADLRRCVRAHRWGPSPRRAATSS